MRLAATHKMSSMLSIFRFRQRDKRRKMEEEAGVEPCSRRSGSGRRQGDIQVAVGARSWLLVALRRRKIWRSSGGADPRTTKGPPKTMDLPRSNEVEAAGVEPNDGQSLLWRPYQGRARLTANHSFGWSFANRSMAGRRSEREDRGRQPMLDSVGARSNSKCSPA